MIYPKKTWIISAFVNLMLINIIIYPGFLWLYESVTSKRTRSFDSVKLVPLYLPDFPPGILDWRMVPNLYVVARPTSELQVP